MILKKFDLEIDDNKYNITIDKITEKDIEQGVEVSNAFERAIKLYKEIMYKKYTQVANDIIGGKYGNGEKRRVAIERAGYDYDFAQCLVDAILGGE